MTFRDVPNELMYNIGSYLPSNASQTRKLALGLDPYDEAVLNDLRDLGIDPLVLVAQERERRRELRELLSRPGGKMARTFRNYGLPWSANSIPGIEFNIRFPLSGVSPDLMRSFGVDAHLTTDPNVLRIADPTGKIYTDLVKADMTLAPADISISTYYQSK